MIIHAIVVKKSPVREHDLTVTLYSRELGKCIAVAKSALKAQSVQAAQIDEGNIIRCELVSGHAIPIITAAQSLRCWGQAKASPLRWAAAQFFLQVIDTVVYDGQVDEALFDSIQATLEELDTARDPEILAILRRRQGDLLNVLGYGTAIVAMAGSLRWGRTALDQVYEQIAQRKFGTLDLLYEMART